MRRNWGLASELLRKLLGRSGPRPQPGFVPDAYGQLAYGNLFLDTLPDRKTDEGNSKAIGLLQRVGLRVSVCPAHTRMLGAQEHARARACRVPAHNASIST